MVLSKGPFASEHRKEANGHMRAKACLCGHLGELDSKTSHNVEIALPRKNLRGYCGTLAMSALAGCRLVYRMVTIYVGAGELQNIVCSCELDA